MLAIAFDRAIVLGLAKKNPARMIGNVKSRKPKIDFWTLDEFQKVISLLYKGDYYEHYLFISFLHIPQELRIRSRGTERHSASN